MPSVGDYRQEKGSADHSGEDDHLERAKNVKLLGKKHSQMRKQSIVCDLIHTHLNTWPWPSFHVYGIFMPKIAATREYTDKQTVPELRNSSSCVHKHKEKGECGLSSEKGSTETYSKKHPNCYNKCVS